MRDGAVAGLVFVLALVPRLLHLAAIARHDPFFTRAGVDGAIYDAWARSILAGEGLGEGVLFLGPLYPLFLAGVYAVFGESLAALKAVQAVLGAGACVLVFGLARELFDRRVAVLAGGAAALSAMPIFYGGTVMIVNLQVPLVVGLVWALLRTLRRPGFAGFALCGALLGLSALARQTTLLMAPILALWVLFGWPGPHAFARRLAWGTTFGLVILALILPFSWHNWSRGGDLVLLNSTGGYNFYMGNQRGADGSWQVPSIGTRHRVDNPEAMREAFTRAAEEALDRTLRPSEVSAYWLARGLDEIRADPMRWLRLELRKLGLFFNAYEVWNNRSIEVSRELSWVLRGPLLPFGVIAPLGLLGLALTARRWRELVPVHAALAAYLAAALLFFVLSRYRLPAAMLLVPFAAHAAIELWDRARARETRAIGVRTIALGLLAVLVHLPLANENRMHMAWYNLGNAYRELERWDEAIGAYRRSLAENPQAISTHNNLAVACEGAGDRDCAIEAWKRVRAIAFRTRDRIRLERATRHLRELESAPGAAPEPTGTPDADAAGAGDAAQERVGGGDVGRGLA